MHQHEIESRLQLQERAIDSLNVAISASDGCFKKHDALLHELEARIVALEAKESGSEPSAKENAPEGAGE